MLYFTESRGKRNTNNLMGSDPSIVKVIEFMKGFQTAPAILAPGRKPLSHTNLCDHIEYVVSFLHELGIGRNDRIGVILPNGPEMTATFLSVITCATFVPLNPAYKEHEYDFALTEMKVKALILEAEKASPARNVAGKKKIPIIELMPQGDAEAGLFRLECNKAAGADDHTSGLSQPDDIALLLQTSGTTSRPKIVPLTVSNIISSAQYIIDSLHLQPSDRCLNIMSMFHIAGLVSPVLASLSAGGSVICAPGFSRDSFFDWICECRPTWYSAVPTIHKETIEISEHVRFQPEQNPLRFIRSISFSIPPSVSQKLEDIFHVPVIQTYGMTEALPITSSPFPPGPQNYDSVGIAAGPDVAVMDAQGRILEPGNTGEIVVRGPNVTKGYEDNPGANEKSFVSGWFKTGDLGYMDKDGYLYIRGRLKEIINRGGQKVSPYEIEEILEKHPAVVDIAAFGVPHHRLGEAVVAAVVAERSQKVTEEELRASLSEQLTGFKVPQQIIFVDGIPRGPSGKIRRDELSGTFAHLLRPDFVPPETETEKMVSRLWGDVLGVEKVGKNDNFFTLGGDSLLATQMVARLSTMMEKRFPAKTIFEHTTVGKFAWAVSCLCSGLPITSGQTSSPVQINPDAPKVPLFWLHDTFLAKHLESDQPLYVVRHWIPDEEITSLNSVEERAAHYLKEVRSIRPKGPYVLGGYCFSSVVALEMARQLIQQGDEVPLLFLVEPSYRLLPTDCQPAGHSLKDKFMYHSRKIVAMQRTERMTYVSRKLPLVLPYLKDKAIEAIKLALCKTYLLFGQSLPAALKVFYTHTCYVRQPLFRYTPEVYPGNVVIFQPERTPDGVRRDWKDIASGKTEIHEIPGAEHLTIIQEPYINALSQQLTAYIDQIQGKISGERTMEKPFERRIISS